MNILITGSKGFIGQNFKKFLEKNNKIFEYEFDEKNSPSLKNIDLVIHCGAISSTTETNIDRIWKQNYYFTKNLIKKCIEDNVSLQIASSASVYGNIHSVKVNEQSKCLPLSPYAWSKYLIDKYLIDEIFPILSNNIFIQSYRYFNVYGNYEDHKGSQMSPISKFSKQAIDKKKITLFKNSENYFRDFICVNDLVKIQKLMSEQKINFIANLGTENTMSFKKVAEIIAHKYNVEIEEIDMPEKIAKHYQSYTCSENSVLKKYYKKYRFISVESYINK